MKKTVPLLALLMVCSVAHAQNEFDALRYNTHDIMGDAKSSAMGGAHYGSFTGLSSYTVNPATMAFLKKSSFSISLGNSEQIENTTYLDRTREFRRTQTGIGDLNFAYVFPTVQGSLVVGGGYTTLADFNRTYSINAFNTENSITDMMANDGFYRNIGYFGLALDSTGFGGVQSRFRFYDSFDGIDQYAETFEGGRIGEMSLYFATEFQENMFLGASIGLPTGSYSYRRTFLERDLSNFYNEFPDDIQSVSLTDRINADISGFYFRVGFAFKPTEFIRIGASYQSQSTLYISETYSSEVFTVFDDGETTDDNRARLRGQFDYKIVRPPRLGIGMSILDQMGLNLHLSMDYIDHSRLSFDFGQDLASALNANQGIENRLQAAANYRVGASYDMNPQTQLLAGFARMGSPRQDVDMSRNILSAGLSMKVSPKLHVDVGAQYHMWNDELQLYGFNQGGTNVSMMASQAVNRIFLNAGLRLIF